MIESSLPQSEGVSLPVRPFGQVARSVLAYGGLTALMLVSPLLVFAPASLFHCAARNGRKAAWGAFLVAAALAALYFAQVANVSDAGAGKMAYASFTAVILSIALPSMAALPLLERNEKFGNVVTFAILGSGVGLGLTEVLLRALGSFSPFETQAVQARETATRILELYKSAGAGSEVIGGIQQWMDYAMYVLPAWILIDVCLIFILSLMMLGRLKAWRAFAGSRNHVVPDEERVYLFRHLAFPEWVLFAFVFGGLTPLASGLLQKVAANTLTVILFLYLLQGLAIFRFMLVKAGAGVLATTLGFLLLIMLSITGIGLLLLVVAGLFDPFFDFRHLKRKDDSHESHTD